MDQFLIVQYMLPNNSSLVTLKHVPSTSIKCISNAHSVIFNVPGDPENLITGEALARLERSSAGVLVYVVFWFHLLSSHNYSPDLMTSLFCASGIQSGLGWHFLCSGLHWLGPWGCGQMA